jgi:hypothetical protein
MKLFIILTSLLFSVNSLPGQKLSKIDTLRYKTMVSKQENKNFKNGMDINVYLASDNNVYKIKDTLVLGEPTGKISNVLNKNRNYEFLFYGTKKCVLSKRLRYLEEDYVGYKLIIEKIQYYKGGLGLENSVYFYVKPVSDANFTLVDKFITLTKVDNAILRGEIKPLQITSPMTREKGLTYLKSKKEELDLGIISEEEYIKIKKEITQRIKSAK